MLPHMQAMLTVTSPKSLYSLTDSLRELSCLLMLDLMGEFMEVVSEDSLMEFSAELLETESEECLEELFLLQLNSEMFSFLIALVCIGEVTEEPTVEVEKALEDLSDESEEITSEAKGSYVVVES